MNKVLDTNDLFKKNFKDANEFKSWFNVNRFKKMKKTIINYQDDIKLKIKQLTKSKVIN